ncbi:sigma-70 family RNA polymerase sigma factor [Nocardia arthritidis]|uniref:Sigma-70 family RNA polymerase sigma factor n=1 Tax=Nocardia arthritidis TaxID=228602 RepID=A0A6G9YFX7_9NOCA|nr:sigma-70 family RNA polymerase sigma factor [Nocardia arthritidis]QIS12098.1 sigma-70 family RNA polymerase sigma factor [Nocardia arthritidis]
MRAQDLLARRFDAQRGRLRAVAYRLLGTADDTEDAVQEAWLRLSRTDIAEVENLEGWLTTVVSRICLDILRGRTAHPEDPTADLAALGATADQDPEHEVLLIDSVGRALLVVLDRLGPEERVAFVLHDMFALPFDRIAPILNRSAATTKKLASRARHRVHGESRPAAVDLAEQQRVVAAFLAAARGGDLGELLAVLAPDVVRTADPAALPAGMAVTVRGAARVAEETVVLRRRSGFAALALVDGAVGIVVAPHGRLLLALRVTVRDNRIAAYEVIADPKRLRDTDIAVLDRPGDGFQPAGTDSDTPVLLP